MTEQDQVPQGSPTGTPDQQKGAENQNSGAAPDPKAQSNPDAGAKTPKGDSKVIPEKYDLKLPEGSRLDADHLETLSALAKERKLTNAEAQDILERDHAVLSAFEDRQRQEAEVMKDEWAKAALSDKEYGGEKYKESITLAKRVIDQFGSNALKEQLNRSGLGNHPELIRLMVRIGKEISAGSLVVSKGEKPPEKTAGEIFYGSK